MDAFMYPEAPGPDMPDSEPGALEAAPAEEEPSNHIDAAVIAFIPAAVRRNKLAAAGPVKASKPLLKPAPGPRRPTYMTHPEPGVMPGGALSYVTPTAAKEGVAILGQPQEKPKNNQDFADFMKELGELGAFES